MVLIMDERTVALIGKTFYVSFVRVDMLLCLQF
jgi:hypothetical protein